MVSNKELVDAFMHYRNFKRIKGNDEDLGPLVPLILLDIQFSIFNKTIKPVKCRYELAFYRKMWIHNYNMFNRGSFFAFKDEYRDRIIDLMDDLEATIDYNTMLLRVSVMDVLKEFEFEHQQILADCVVCNTLIQFAQSWWRGTYKTPGRNPETNPYIAGMMKASVGYINEYIDKIVGFKGRIKLNSHPEIVKNAELLDDKIINWVKKQESCQ